MDVCVDDGDVCGDVVVVLLYFVLFDVFGCLKCCWLFGGC